MEVVFAFITLVMLLMVHGYLFVALCLFLTSLITFRFEDPTRTVKTVLLLSIKVSCFWPFLVYTSISKKMKEKNK